MSGVSGAGALRTWFFEEVGWEGFPEELAVQCIPKETHPLDVWGLGLLNRRFAEFFRRNVVWAEVLAHDMREEIAYDAREYWAFERYGAYMQVPKNVKKHRWTCQQLFHVGTNVTAMDLCGNRLYLGVGSEVQEWQIREGARYRIASLAVKHIWKVQVRGCYLGASGNSDAWDYAQGSLTVWELEHQEDKPKIKRVAFEGKGYFEIYAGHVYVQPPQSNSIEVRDLQKSDEVLQVISLESHSVPNWLIQEGVLEYKRAFTTCWEFLDGSCLPIEKKRVKGSGDFLDNWYAFMERNHLYRYSNMGKCEILNAKTQEVVYAHKEERSFQSVSLNQHHQGHFIVGNFEGAPAALFRMPCPCFFTSGLINTIDPLYRGTSVWHCSEAGFIEKYDLAPACPSKFSVEELKRNQKLVEDMAWGATERIPELHPHFQTQFARLKSTNALSMEIHLELLFHAVDQEDRKWQRTLLSRLQEGAWGAYDALNKKIRKEVASDIQLKYPLFLDAKVWTSTKWLCLQAVRDEFFCPVVFP